ncbi:MAG TPA: macrolide family glycosyltransferase [Anaerolineales bacterium]|nr:macrolide family glycosyltransferase [Anaerolineales bacterium]
MNPTPTALFFNVPGHGHVNPSLPLVAELTRRGHRITYFITEGYRAKVEAAGAKVQIYASVKDDYFDARNLDGSHPQLVACELLKTTEEVLPGLLETARAAHPDYILYDCMCPWGYWTARVLKVPAVASFSLMPTVLRALLQKSTLKIMFPIMFRDFSKGLEANRRSQALGKQYAIPHLGPASLLTAEGDLSLSYTSAEFMPFPESAPKSFRFVGRTLEAEPGVDPALFKRVGDRPLVYISMGTVNNKNRSLVDFWIHAFAGRDEFVMLTTGNRFKPEDFGSLPENISIHPWLPQIAVLQKASLFINHGGLNSIHDGLYFGVPLLLCPQQEEQTFNASRVVELGAGLMLPKAKLTQENLRATADQLLTDPRFKTNAQRVGETFRAAGGMKKAADEIEALLEQNVR